MDINRIALFLAGKFPPYYGVSFDKLELVELIRAKSPQSFSDDFFKIFDSQDFYSNCLKRVERADKGNLVDIVKSLNVPEDAGGLSKNDLIVDKLKELEKEYIEMNNSKAIKVTDRGYQFEKWLIKFFELYDLKPRASYKTDFDQIDGSFELDGREYLLEAKWTKNPSDTGVGDKMFGRLDRCLVGTVGLVISKSGFTDNARETILRHKNILLVNGEDLESVLEGKITLNDLLKAVRRRAAEEGKPYLS